jgi:hypothetical protein
VIKPLDVQECAFHGVARQVNIKSKDVKGYGSEFKHAGVKKMNAESLPAEVGFRSSSMFRVFLPIGQNCAGSAIVLAKSSIPQ